MWRRRELKPKFPLGAVRVTGAAQGIVDESEHTVTDLLERHAAGDWGCLHPYDKANNDRSIRMGLPLGSLYDLGGADKVFVFTAWDRSYTEVMTQPEGAKKYPESYAVPADPF